ENCTRYLTQASYQGGSGLQGEEGFSQASRLRLRRGAKPQAAPGLFPLQRLGEERVDVLPRLLRLVGAVLGVIALGVLLAHEAVAGPLEDGDLLGLLAGRLQGVLELADVGRLDAHVVL